MARLIVLQNDLEIGALTLEKGKDYTVGRATENNLVLNEANLSRQHFKITFENNTWMVQLTARYGEIIFNNQSQKSFELKDNDTFKVTPYVFVFTETSQNITQEPIDQTSEKIAYFDSDEKTFVANMASMGIPYITITYPDKHNDVLRMEGEYWVIGRDLKNEIFIDDPKSSRAHAEITKHSDFFTLRDLKSSNGTYFNGARLQANSPIAISSGDQFTIGNTSFQFEIRDPNFESNTSSFANTNQHIPKSEGAIRIDKPIYLQKQNIAIALIVIILSFVFLTEEPKTKSKKGKASLASKSKNDQTVDISSLTKEQKEFVDKTYKLAKTLYMSQKYELALSEVQKIHELIANYEDSKEIESLSREAIDLKMQQHKIELVEQQQQETFEQIKVIVDRCADDFTASPSSPISVRECLSQALELDPSNAEAQALIDKAEQYQQKKDIELQNQMAYQSRIQSGKEMFHKAKQLREKGKLLEALDTYKRHIASALPDPDNLKPKSQIEIQSLSQEMSSKISSYKSAAEQFRSQEKFREAIQKLNQALQIDPSSGELRTLQKEYSQELYKNMKTLYADSVLEENLGNVEAAKEKWKKIRSQDLPQGEYQEKARSKLKKYGLE